jgi:hypothetical protein
MEAVLHFRELTKPQQELPRWGFFYGRPSARRATSGSASSPNLRLSGPLAQPSNLCRNADRPAAPEERWQLVVAAALGLDEARILQLRRDVPATKALPWPVRLLWKGHIGEKAPSGGEPLGAKEAILTCSRIFGPSIKLRDWLPIRRERCARCVLRKSRSKRAVNPPHLWASNFPQF